MSKSSPRTTARGVLFAAACGALLGLGSFTVYYAEGLSYLSNDPKACVNCHIMREQYDGWQKASHHAHATCNDCHVPHDPIRKYLVKAEHGFRHSRGFTFQDFHEPIRIKPSSSRVVHENCVRCHSELVGDIVGHRAEPWEARGCVHCHDRVGHGP